MIIRPETMGDYGPIADVHARAFGNRASEALIVALSRQTAAFDPELSLVAESDGRVAGHALFLPHTVRVLGQDVRAVGLGPIGVHPAMQRQGIGGRLIEEGHRIATAKGHAFSFLLGHPSYYPRFGYRTRAYGWSEVRAPVEGLRQEPLGERSPRPEDLPALDALWREAESGVDLSLRPGSSLLDWISPNPAIKAIVFHRAEEIVGYARIHASEPSKPRIFLARDGEGGRAMAAAIARRAGDAGELTLPLHPLSAASAGFDPPSCRPWDAAMTMRLGPSPLDEYLSLLEAGGRPPGRPIWPVAFDL